MLEVGIAVALMAATPLVAAAAVRFEFYNLETNTTQSSFPLGAKNEIIVRSDDTNVSELLPLAIVIQADSTRYKNAIPNNPELACANEFMCSVAGPVIPTTTKYVEVQAITTSGEVLAAYTVGTPPAGSRPSSAPTPTSASPLTAPIPIVSTPVPVETATSDDTPALFTPAPGNPTEVSAENNDRNPYLLIVALLLLLGAGVGMFLNTIGNECVDACKLGDCQSCELNNLILGTHGVPKGAEKDLVDLGKLLFDLLGLAPLPVAGPAGKGLTGGVGGTVSKPVIKEGLEKAAEVLKGRSGMGTWGVDIWARLEMKKCKEVMCWPRFWQSKTAWVSEFNDVKLEPPDAFKHKGGGPDVGWNYHYLFSPDPKDRKHIGRIIRELALKHCGNCPHARNV